VRYSIADSKNTTAVQSYMQQGPKTKARRATQRLTFGSHLKSRVCWFFCKGRGKKWRSGWRSCPQNPVAMCL